MTYWKVRKSGKKALIYSDMECTILSKESYVPGTYFYGYEVASGTIKINGINGYVKQYVHGKANIKHVYKVNKS